MGKELDDICTSCPYIDAIKRHKQQLGAIEEYTQWLKKEPRASYFFLFRLYTRIHNTFFPKKQQLPFTPGGTHCPEPDVTLRDLTLSPGYHSDYAPQPIPEMDSSAVVPPTNETPRLRKILPTTLRPEAIPDKRKRPETQDSHPFLKNVQECPRNICGLPQGFHRNRRLPVPKESRCAPCIRIKSTVKLYGSAPVTCGNPDQRLRGRSSTQYSVNGPASSMITPPPFRGWTAGTVNSVTGYGTPCRSGVWEPR